MYETQLGLSQCAEAPAFDYCAVRIICMFTVWITAQQSTHGADQGIERLIKSTLE